MPNDKQEKLNKDKNKNKEKKGITIRIARREGRRNIVRMATEAALSVLMTAAIWLLIYHSLGLKETGTEWLTGGLPVLADRFMDRLTILTLEIHDGVAHQHSLINTVFTPVMMLFTFIISWIAVRMRIPVIPVIFIALGAAGLVVGIIPQDIYVIIYFAVIVLVIAYRRFASSACLAHYRNASFITAGSAVLALIVAGMLSLTGLYGTIDVDSIRSYAEQRQHEKIYEKQANPMPEGRISEAREFQPGEAPALEVSESNWETTYLKGFVGEEYKGGKWIRERDEKIPDDADMFYWMHKEGFYAQAEVGNAYSLTGSEADEYVAVTNINACRRYCYLPYGALIEDDSFFDEKAIGDLNVTVDDPADSSDYIYPTIKGAAASSRAVQKAVKSRDSGQDADTLKYLDKEEAYRKYCRRRYLDVPEDLKDAIGERLGDPGKLSTTEAMQLVLEYMQTNVKYSEKTDNSGADPIMTFLTDSRKGYAVHYASLAVMMLRYCGIPARYAEGFIVPEMLYEGAPGMSSISVPLKFSHAWAEYYLDGVGWLPFETVPKYLESGSEGVDKNKTSGKKSKEDKKKDNKKNIDNPLNRVGAVFVMNIKPLIAVGIALLLALLWIFIMRRRRLSRFIGTFKGKDADAAVKNAFAYGIALLKACGIRLNNTLLRETAASSGLSDDGRQKIKRCIEINEEVRYGGRSATEEQRKAVLEFQDAAVKIYKEKRTLTGKIWDRVVRCIY